LLEILALEEDLEKERKNASRLRKILCAGILGIIFCLGAIMCMGIAAVEITKETRVRGGNPVSKASSGTAVAPTASRRRRRLFAGKAKEPERKTDEPKLNPKEKAAREKSLLDKRQETVDTKDMSGREKAEYTQKIYEDKADKCAEFFETRVADGKLDFPSKEEMDPACNEVHACIFHDGASITSWPTSDCPTMPDPADPKGEKMTVDFKALYYGIGTDMPIDIDPKHGKWLIKNAKNADETVDPVEVMKNYIGSPPQITNGAPRFVALRDGNDDKMLKSCDKIVVRNKETGFTLELDARVFQEEQEEEGMSGNIVVDVKSDTPGVADGKLQIKADGSFLIDDKVRSKFAKHQELAPELVGKFPEQTEMDGGKFTVCAKCMESFPGEKTEAGIEKMFPGSKVSKDAQGKGEIEFAKPSVNPNVLKEGVPATVITKRYVQCDENKENPCKMTDDDTQVRQNGEEKDFNGDVLTKFSLFREEIVEEDFDPVNKIKVTHTKLPCKMKLGEDFGPDMPHICHEVTKIDDGNVVLTKKSEYADPFKRPPKQLPEGVESVAHDGTFLCMAGTDKQDDCHVFAEVKDSAWKNFANEDLAKIAGAKEKGAKELERRRLLVDGSHPLVAAHVHARALETALGGKSTIFENKDKHGNVDFVVEHCEDESNLDDKEISTLKTDMKSITGRKLKRHLHDRRLALYATHIAIRPSRSHRRLAKRGRQVAHKLHRIAQRHLEITGRRLTSEAKKRLHDMKTNTVDKETIKTTIETSDSKLPSSTKTAFEKASEHNKDVIEEMKEAYKKTEEIREELKKPGKTIEDVKELVTQAKDLENHVAVVKSFLEKSKVKERQVEEMVRTYVEVKERKNMQ
jgi:hypothetical protein